MGGSSKTIAEMTAEIREVNIALGWRSADGGPSRTSGENTWGDYMALLHSEISEALEAYRDHRLEDATAVDDCEGPVCDIHGHGPNKPEGVGSELADVLIRLLDMCDVFGIEFEPNLRLSDVESIEITETPPPTFGDLMSWLHVKAARMAVDRVGAVESATVMLLALVTVARHLDIDLERECERKVRYNKTRPFQHGGRTLAGEKETKDA